MNKFIQMDIFFFIARVGTIIFAIFLSIIAVYTVIIIRKVNKIVEEAKKLAEIIAEEGGKTAELIREKAEDVVSDSGLPQKILTTVLTAVINQVVNKKIKKKLK